MPAAASRKMIIYLLAPPILWSVHFLFVYVFVSLACLWTWAELSFLGLGVIGWGVALMTLTIGAAIIVIGLQGWRRRPDAPRLVFLARITVMMSAIFLFAILFIGLLTLSAAPCS